MERETGQIPGGVPGCISPDFRVTFRNAYGSDSGVLHLTCGWFDGGSHIGLLVFSEEEQAALKSALMPARRIRPSSPSSLRSPSLPELFPAPASPSFPPTRRKSRLRLDRCSRRDSRRRGRPEAARVRARPRVDLGRRRVLLRRPPRQDGAGAAVRQRPGPFRRRARADNRGRQGRVPRPQAAAGHRAAMGLRVPVPRRPRGRVQRLPRRTRRRAPQDHRRPVGSIDRRGRTVVPVEYPEDRLPSRLGYAPNGGEP